MIPFHHQYFNFFSLQRCLLSNILQSKKLILQKERRPAAKTKKTTIFYNAKDCKRLSQIFIHLQAPTREKEKEDILNLKLPIEIFNQECILEVNTI